MILTRLPIADSRHPCETKDARKRIADAGAISSCVGCPCRDDSRSRSSGSVPNTLPPEIRFPRCPCGWRRTELLQQLQHQQQPCRHSSEEDSWQREEERCWGR